MSTFIKVPAQGQKITPGKPIPDNPIIPFIEGDGIGVDITPVMQKVVDAAVQKAYSGKRKISWMEFMQAKKLPVFMVQMSGCLKKPLLPAKSTQSLSKDR